MIEQDDNSIGPLSADDLVASSTLSPSERHSIYTKAGGRCSNCGCPINQNRFCFNTTTKEILCPVCVGVFRVLLYFPDTDIKAEIIERIYDEAVSEITGSATPREGLNDEQIWDICDTMIAKLSSIHNENDNL